jgi:hypothetical protein
MKPGDHREPWVPLGFWGRLQYRFRAGVARCLYAFARWLREG